MGGYKQGRGPSEGQNWSTNSEKGENIERIAKSENGAMPHGSIIHSFCASFPRKFVIFALIHAHKSKGSLYF